MNSFVDAKGGQWRVEINCGTLAAVQDSLGVNIGQLPADDGAASVWDDLVRDDLMLGKTLYALVRDQAESRNPAVTEAQFLHALNGEALKAGEKIFWEQVTAFFRDRGREIVAQGLEASLATVGDAMTNADLLETIETGVRQAAQEQMAAISGKLSGNLQESSVSTRDHSLSDN